MPLPWNNQGGSEEEKPSVPSYAGVVRPPQYENLLDFQTIDTRRYASVTKTRHSERNIVTSAKTETDMIDQFCEENTSIRNHDTTEPPSDYDIAKEVNKTLTDERMIKNLERVRVKTLNAVQRKSIKVIRDGEGLLVEAPTGIGKTYAFLIPIIERTLKERRERSFQTDKPSPVVLIIASTNPLVKQLFSRCELILGLKCMEDVEPIHDIKIDMMVANYTFTKDQCDIAFCTMGKLKATIESGDVCLDNLKMIVLDEADKMIDNFTFGLDIDWILSQLKEDVRNNLQSCFFSATFLKDQYGCINLTALQTRMLGDKPWKIVHCPRMPGYISQNIIKLGRPGNDISSHPWVAKMKIIRNLIDKDLEETNCSKEGPFKQTIAIFCETIGRVAQVAMALRQMGYNFKPVCRMVAKDQQDVTVNDLEFCRIQGIVCTNILSRGIDVASVKHTIIMEMSKEFDTYKHRIGRVGRDGSGGKATVLIDHNLLMDGHSAQILDQLYMFLDEFNEAPDWMTKWFQERYPDGYYRD